MTTQELKRVAWHFASMLVLSASLVLPAGCGSVLLWDQSAFQTGKVLGKGKNRASLRTTIIYPTQGLFNLGLGNGWEIGGEAGLKSFGWGGGLSATRRLYSSQHLFSSALFQTELSFKDEFRLNLVRVTTAVAGSYYPTHWFGIYSPLRLSAVFSPPDSLPYSRWIQDDSLHHHRETWYKHFGGLKDVILTPGIGLSFEGKQGYVRLGYNFPLIAPHVASDSVIQGLEVVPYFGIEAGARLF